MRLFDDSMSSFNLSPRLGLLLLSHFSRSRSLLTTSGITPEIRRRMSTLSSDDKIDAPEGQYLLVP